MKRMSRRPTRRWRARARRASWSWTTSPTSASCSSSRWRRWASAWTRVGSIAEAKERLKAERYDLCLTDMRLADGEGLELVRHIGALRRRTCRWR